MKKKFTEEQIAFALKQAEHGTPVAEVIRDVAQDINHFDNLFDFIGRNTKFYIDKDKKLIQ